jgi:hypothetical protein
MLCAIFLSGGRLRRGLSICSAEQVRQTQADAQDAQAADQHSFPLPTKSAREHEPDAPQNSANDEGRRPRHDRRDDASAAGVLGPDIGGHDGEQPADDPERASANTHARHAQMVLHTQVPARPQ